MGRGIVLKGLAPTRSWLIIFEPEGNGCAERFIRTLKENLFWVRTLETVEQLRLALLEFKKTYNEQCIIQKFGYQTPSQARKDACKNPKKAA